MRNAFANAFYEHARKDPRICLVVADITAAAGVASFQKESPERFINVGVAEQMMIGMCAGLALRGCIPFAYTIATFTIYRPFEMVRVDCCYQNLPVKLVGVGAGVNYSTLGGTHHAQEDVAIMSAIPNMTVLAPCDPAEAAAMTSASIEVPGPVYLRLGKAGEPILGNGESDPIEFGRVRFLKSGSDMCLLAYGPITRIAMALAARFEKEGRSVAVVSVHTLKPLDSAGIAKILQSYETVAVIEEHAPFGGLGPQVEQLAWSTRAECRLHTFSLKDEFIHVYGSHQDLLSAHGLDEEVIYEKLARRDVPRLPTERLTHASILQEGRYSGLSLDGVEPDTLRALYKSMVRLRRCEEAMITRYRLAEEMRCPVHFTLGQEAVSAALSLLVKPDDFMFSHHRCHGYLLAKGAPMRAFFAELFGRATGANGGLAGSQEISMPSANFFSGAILTGASSMAVGAAFAFQHRDTPQIAVAGFGEAATEEGIFWEGITYASVKKLPLVFVCENNLYSMYSTQTARQSGDDISRRVASFGFKTYTLFGNDAPAAYLALREAMEHARSGRGPCFLEFYTYRWNAHVGPESDDYINYRNTGEIEFWKTNDPIVLLEEKLTPAGLLSDTVKAAMISEIDAEIADAFDYAANSPFPGDLDLEALNRSPSSPVAEKLLPTSTHGEFDENQPAAKLAPY